MEEHKIIEKLLQDFKCEKIKIVNDIDYAIYPFAPINATFIGKYKYDIAKDLKSGNLLVNCNLNVDNAHIFYKYIDDETKETYRSNLNHIHSLRWKAIVSFLKKEGHIFEVREDIWDNDFLHENREAEHLYCNEPVTYYKKVSYFGVEDILKPINNYIEEIKNSDGYKKAVDAKNNIILNTVDSFTKNLKNNVDNVTLTDVALKTPKGVAIEVGLKTLKDTAIDIIDGVVDSKYLDILIKKHENAPKKELDSSVKAYLQTVDVPNENGKYLCNIKYEHDNGDIFRESEYLSKSELFKMLNGIDVRNYTEHLDENEESDLIKSLYYDTSNIDFYSIHIDEPENKYVVLFNHKYLGEAPLNRTPNSPKDYKELLDDFRKSNNIKDMEYYKELIDNTKIPNELFKISNELRDNSVKKVFNEPLLDKVELANKSDEKANKYFEDIKNEKIKNEVSSSKVNKQR